MKKTVFALSCLFASVAGVAYSSPRLRGEDSLPQEAKPIGSASLVRGDLAVPASLHLPLTLALSPQAGRGGARRGESATVIMVADEGKSLAGQNLGEVLDKSEARRKVVEKLRYGIPGLPSWARYFIRRNDYVSTPSEEVEIGGAKYQLFHTCQPGNCSGMQMHILFSADGKQAWMRLFEKGKPDIFLGEPDEGQKKALMEKNGL